MKHKFKITASGSAPQFSIRTLENRRMVYPFHSVKTRRPFSRKQKASGHNGQTAFYRHENAMTQMINWVSTRFNATFHNFCRWENRRSKAQHQTTRQLSSALQFKKV
jgi:hypothetical protein